MFRRVFWLVLGTCLGLGGSFWLSRWARRQVERLLPARALDRAVRTARKVGDELADVARVARDAMREREAALRAEFVERP